MNLNHLVELIIVWSLTDQHSKLTLIKRQTDIQLLEILSLWLVKRYLSPLSLGFLGLHTRDDALQFTKHIQILTLMLHVFNMRPSLTY